MPQSPLAPPSAISDPAADRLESLPDDSDVRAELRTAAAGLLSELRLGGGSARRSRGVRQGLCTRGAGDRAQVRAGPEGWVTLQAAPHPRKRGQAELGTRDPGSARETGSDAQFWAPEGLFVATAAPPAQAQASLTL